jgi:hypothetical protein
MSPAIGRTVVKIAQMVWSSRALATLAMASILAACGVSSNKSGAGGQQQSRDMKPGRQSAEIVDPDMVAAVSSARSTTPINMKFGLSARPAIGTPLTVTLALIPASDVGISHIHVLFQPGDGLQLQSDRTLDISQPGPGTVIEQELSVVPQQAGVLSLNATVVVDMDGGSLARSYAIPLIVR